MRKTEHEQQIEAQAGTIESLQKTVERLERELEKCLEPGRDSDTTLTTESATPTFRKLQRHDIFCEAIYGACAGPFIPFWKDGEKGKLFYSSVERWEWLMGRLLDKSEYWGMPSFRNAFKTITDFTHKLSVQKEAGLGEGAYNDVAKEVGGLIARVEPEEHQGFILIRESLVKIRSEYDWCFDRLDYLLASLTIFIECQKLWLESEDLPEMEEEEEEEEDEDEEQEETE